MPIINVKYAGEHYCKVLSLCSVNNLLNNGKTFRWKDWEGYLDIQLRVGGRFKRNPLTDDDVQEFGGELINPPDTDRFYQQWGSTRYSTNPAGTFTLSLGFNYHGRVDANIDSDYMVRWVRKQYFPTMVIVHFRQNVLQTISADAARGLRRGKYRSKLIEFRKVLWLYTVTHDIQDERIWVETKAANRLDALFTSLNGQVGDEAQETLNLGVKFLTVAGVAVLCSVLRLAFYR